MSHKLPDLCLMVLRQIYGDKLDEYEVSNEGSGQKGQGYVNEMFFLNVKKGDEDTHLVLKTMPDIKDKNRELVSVLYETEINFYENVWPALDRFQKSVLSRGYFDKIARCFGSASVEGRRAIVLENLKRADFVLEDKNLFHDGNLIEFAFKNYGVFHALSLALKHKDPKEYNRLKNSFPNNSWHNFRDSSLIRVILPDLTMLAISRLDDADDDMKKKMIQFGRRVLQEFADVTLYRGSYDVITHGDCWINNFMFKKNDSGQPEDVRLIDFQFVQAATPVYDLSYFFYSGATKDQLAHLEHFLRVYHRSLSSKLREFGCDPDQLYPYEVLKDEWKQYSKFGFIMGILLLAEKFCEPVDILNDAELRESSDDKHFDKEQYVRYTKDLIHHVYQSGFV